MATRESLFNEAKLILHKVDALERAGSPESAADFLMSNRGFLGEVIDALMNTRKIDVVDVLSTECTGDTK